MANAPPTPPPTTAAELLDQSLSQSQGSSTAPPPPVPPAQDSFPASFPLIVDLAAKAQYHDLIFKAEEIDVLVRHPPLFEG
jgi:COP9 signalosome complex subunit 8